MLKYLPLALLAAAPALAAEPAAPATLILPTALVRQVAGYLATRPYAEVEVLMSDIRGCVAVQVSIATAACPEVTEALKARDDAQAKAAVGPKAVSALP